MILSGHQPVYLPWLGLFHKLFLCDVFVYMDTVQYLSNDWNNRNRIRTPQGWSWLTVPIDKARSSGNRLHEIVPLQDPAAAPVPEWQERHWASIERNYARAEHFETYAPALREMYLRTRWATLVDLCCAQFTLFSGWLGISRRVIRMSEHPFSGHKDELVLQQAKELGATTVLFGAHGRDYVDLEKFAQAGQAVVFQDYVSPVYPQRFPGFEPSLCVLDLFFNVGGDSLAVLLDGNVRRLGTP